MSAYPVKQHIRAASAIFLKHVFGLFDKTATTSIIMGLQNKLTPTATATLMNFLNIPPEDFSGFVFVIKEKVLGLTNAEVRLAKNIKNWCNYEIAKRQDIDLETMTMDDYDAFLLVNAQKMTPTTPVTPSVVPTPQYYPMPPAGPMTPGYSPI